MEGDEAVPDSSSTSRWTCEACGCNTNQTTDRSCTICGTSNSGPSIMRRHGAAYAARVGLIARGLSARRAGMNMPDDLDLDEEELWESVVDNVEMAVGDAAESALESLAMEVSGMGRRFPAASRLVNNSAANSRRLLEVARAFSQSEARAGGAAAAAGGGESLQAPDPVELLRIATENADGYQPRWASPAQLLSRGRSGNDIQVGDRERQNLAHLPSGSGEGRAIRTENALPRPDSSQEPESGKTFGFRVAFDHPTAETGGNMGGCHLVGVTTSSFTAFGDQNGLQQSPFFWGIEDGGQKYEGSHHNLGRGGRRAYSSFRSELVSHEAPFNPSNVLFGCREVVTVVCDYDSRTLTFWRDDTLLGTLITNLPRNGNLFPVAVPFNCGVTVAITGLDSDPLPLLRSYAADCKRTQEEKEDALRGELSASRDRLIEDGKPTEALMKVLKSIFAMYSTGDDSRISYTMACRLWYRCGMKISSLDSVLETENRKLGEVEFKDFLQVVSNVFEADRTRASDIDARPDFETGDMVELVDGYEKYGDASGGPLQPGDRGTVVELQRGPNGERRSVRVLFMGRRWWYQPQAVVSERSGLIESPAVWFINAVMRSHGFNPDSLETMQGLAVTASSWCPGDEVVPRKIWKDSDSAQSTSALQIGCIVPDSSASRSTVTPHNRDSGTVLVEFIGREFTEAIGLKTSTSTDEHATLQLRRVRVNKLFHSAGLHHPEQETTMDDSAADEDIKPANKFINNSSAPLGDKLKSEIAAVGRLEQSAIDAVAKECRKSSDALASLFSAGLPEAVLSAIDFAGKQMNSLEPREELFEKIAAIGLLVTTIAEKLYSDSPDEEDRDTEEVDNESAVTESGVPSAVLARRSRSVGSAAQLRDSMNDYSSNLPDLVNASLQQRRGMILSLMSRAGRRRNMGALNDFSERRSVADAGVGQGVSQFGIPGPPPPFMFGASSLINDVSHESPWESSNMPGLESSPTEKQSNEPGVLDSILRCRGESADAVGDTLRQDGPPFFLFIRHLISRGVLLNSRGWVEALIDSYQSKKNQLTTLHRPPSSLLRNAVDEEGTPILQLAILFGCKPDLVSHLMMCGAPVGPAEVRMAAITNQPRSLSSLLHHFSYVEGLIDSDGCSAEVLHVLEQAKERQDELDRQMRDAAGAFIASVVKKLVSLGLLSRRNQMCSKVVCGVLVGDVLLTALQRAQKTSDASGVQRRDGTLADRSSRVPVEEFSTTSSPAGVLRYLPQSIVGDSILGDTKCATSFFLLLEDYLCSRDMSDTAAGLTMLSIVLSHFPQLRSCTLLERYGLVELTSFHDVLASNKIAELLSKEFTTGLDVSSGVKSESPRMESSVPKMDRSGVVMCPKRHTAVLHITRHSSFRCDICGCGVERGRPMHGCRECDWDACEDCTDKSESGLIKCTAIRELACECLGYMSDAAEMKDDTMVDSSHAAVLDELSQDDTTECLNDIAFRLLKHDPKALKEFACLLQEPGRVSFHQFLSIALPAIHASLSGKSAENEVALLGGKPGHRNKKARVAGCSPSSSLSPDAGYEYCRESVRSLLEPDADDSKVGKCATSAELEGVDGLGQSSTLGSTSSNKSLHGEIAYSNLASEILRRIHQVLSLYEGVTVYSSSVWSHDSAGTEKSGDLHALTKPLQIQLQQYTLGKVNTASSNRLSLTVEPLVPVSDIELHVLRSCRVDDPLYKNYCQSLAIESAIIVEKPRKAQGWQVAKVLQYNELTGAHCVQYASHVEQNVSSVCVEDDSSFVFDGKIANLVLAARDFAVVHRRNDTKQRKSTRSSTTSARKKSEDPSPDLARAVGTRVESNIAGDGLWQVYTLTGFSDISSRDGAVLVSDEGVVFEAVPFDRIRCHLWDRSEGSYGDPDSVQEARRIPDARVSLSRSFPFIAGRRRSSSGGSSASPESPATLRRTWSALALAASMCPVDIKPPPGEEGSLGPPAAPVWSCKIGNNEVSVTCRSSALELSPKLRVTFSTSDKLPSVSLSSSPDTTLASALTTLHRSQEKWREWPPRSGCQLFFALDVDPQSSGLLISGESCFPEDTDAMEVNGGTSLKPPSGKAREWDGRSQDRSRKLSARSSTCEDDEKPSTPLCEGLDEICMQCMDVIRVLSQHAEDSSEGTEPDRPEILGFANPSLSKKLTDQLDDPLCVVGGALPTWCTAATVFSPRVFSYSSRQMLLQRAAFGVSRSTLKQQESKVSVGRLRQRMASLRGRAVELMGEAFSGGAEDPTALQLQADELYGMEEALAARVRAAFRAAKWQEHSLQVAKAAVRRDNLLADAASIMEQYASDENVNRRRLEVRFNGESGFDAASGDEAGVTRGFYADVAESLLSTTTVAGVLCSSNCARIPSTELPSSSKEMEIDDVEEGCKLPLWIPDMDTGAQVVIPTPRADSRSGLGVYPRPLPTYHPQLPEVLSQFRFIGRLFAAAMRDGFMFPLPLSASFLKLVQHAPKQVSFPDANSQSVSQHDYVLTAADLPRPGFLGGEVYAADSHICKALDALDSADPPLSRVELQRRYHDIATDKNFARVAFGMLYDCSFEDYFQDKTFVDPLDPTQGDEAVPLCPRGHKKAVTIYNVREWVALCKDFVLYDGVIAQAVAFRQGVEDFFSATFLRIFTPEELQRDVCGTGDDVDNWDENAVRKLLKLNGGKGAAEALVAVAAIGGEGGAAMSRRFGPSSPTIAFLVKALLEATPKQRRQFLSFVTSVPIVTPGRIEVVPMVAPSGDFLPMHDPSCLPRANTCARRLYVPKFETYESFAQVFWAVVQEESRFKGFYEWRGSN